MVDGQDDSMRVSDGGASRRGPFRAVGSFSAIAVMGGDNIDLRDAEIEGGELTIRVYSMMGAVSIYVPDSVEVELRGFSVLGANREKGAHRRSPAAKAPMIRVRGFNLIGGTTVFRVPLTRIDAKTNTVVRQWIGKGGDSLRVGFGSLWITDYKQGLLVRFPLEELTR